MTTLSTEGSAWDRLKRLLEYIETYGEEAALALLKDLVPKPRPEAWVSASSYLATCTSGDLVLWSGTSGISLAIRFLTWSPFSHASLVLRGPLDESERGTPAASKARLFQSTWSTFAEDVDGRHEQVGEQVMLNDLDVVLAGNLAEGEPGFARALGAPEGSAAALETKLVAFVRETLGDPYPGADRGVPNPIDFLRGLLDLPPELVGTYFCSELVAGAYQAMGVLDRAWVDNAYTPSDFSRAKDDELARYLEPGFSLGPEIGLEQSA